MQPGTITKAPGVAALEIDLDSRRVRHGSESIA